MRYLLLFCAFTASRGLFAGGNCYGPTMCLDDARTVATDAAASVCKRIEEGYRTGVIPQFYCIPRSVCHARFSVDCLRQMAEVRRERPVCQQLIDRGWTDSRGTSADFEWTRDETAACSPACTDDADTIGKEKADLFCDAVEKSYAGGKFVGWPYVRTLPVCESAQSAACLKAIDTQAAIHSLCQKLIAEDWHDSQGWSTATHWSDYRKTACAPYP